MSIGICEECGDYYQRPRDPRKDKRMCKDCEKEAMDGQDTVEKV